MTFAAAVRVVDLAGIDLSPLFGLLAPVKHNFKIDEVVQINRTTDPELDGKFGTILGRSIVDVLDFYIVLLETPHSRGDKAVSMTEACLDFIQKDFAAFDLGRQSAILHIPREGNPFQTDLVKRRSWDLGWCERTKRMYD